MLVVTASVSRATELQVRPVLPARARNAAPPRRPGAKAPSAAASRAERDRLERWRSFRDVVTRPGAAWRHTDSRRRGWQPARAARVGEAAPAPDTLRVAFLRVDFLHDRGNDK